MSTNSNEFKRILPTRPSLHASPPETLFSTPAARPSTLTLRVVRGPLQDSENRSILSQYNRLASADIPEQEFLRWIQESPEGPAWHAILETSGGEIVGHTSLFPFRATHAGRSMVAAKSEYSFIREEFRACKIRGFEQSGRLKNLIYIDELFRKCRGEGWGPLLISTSSSYHRVFRSIACYPVDFTLWECLLVLRPGTAGQRTPNLRPWQKASLWAAGVLQSALWTPASLAAQNSNGIRTVSPDAYAWLGADSALSFFEEQKSLAWRYPQGQYERISAEGPGGGEMIVKQGSEQRYLRVCQWRLDSGPPRLALVAKLVRMARQQRALGIRWSVYGDAATGAALVQRLRHFGFLCVRRTRSLLINTADQRYLDSKEWNLTDSMFTFDL